MIWIVTIALNWLRANSTAKLSLSPTPQGSRLGGHDIQQIPDEYIILDVRAGGRILVFGYFELA